MTQIDIPRVLLAADRSSAGKTTICTGIMAALCRDMDVQPFKVGLDYIDPSYHTLVCGHASRNLDGYLMTENAVLETFLHALNREKTNLAIIEGVRGLYEGFDGLSDIGSTAQIAKILKCPVILIIDARSITRSAAAVVMGYAAFDQEVDIRGVILNKIGSERHAEKAVSAIEQYTNIPVIGAVPRSDDMGLTMRHLGLIPVHENKQSPEFQERISNITRIVSENIDLKRLVEIAETAEPLDIQEPSIFVRHDINNRVRIGVALDEAFNFYYRDNIDLLELHGADIIYFSPLHDASLPDVDGIYIGGGYPELFAKELEANRSMRLCIKRASSDGMPVYGECGGLMYLAEHIITRSGMHGMTGDTFDMVGAIPITVAMGGKVVSYNIGSFITNTPIGGAGDSFRGHEFHHSSVTDISDDAVFAIKLERGTGIRDGWDGIMVENTLAGYAHLHACSYLRFAEAFVEACR
ncbi:MAG: Ni-sirohydrochlorin a,c-diamide synthase [Euryarchaeota archaeon]|nr:Ni-sirohydrochlorin a,c-diamide synthase [Euryarchaeota archaeon]